MKKLLVLPALLFCSVWAPAQAGLTGHKLNTDSLEKKLSTAKEDTNKVILLNMLAMEYKLKDPVKAIRTAELALHLAEKLDYPVGQMASYNQLGIIYKNKSEYEKALDNYSKGLAIGEKFGIRNLSAKISANIGGIYMNRGNFPKALDNFLKSLELFQKMGDKKSMGACYSSVGIVYSRMGKDSLAIVYYKKALEMRRQVNDEYGIANDLGNLGISWGYLAEHSRKKNEYDSAMFYHNQSLALLEKFDDQQGIAQTIDNMSGIMIDLAEMNHDQAEFDRAELLIRKALSINEDIDDKSGIAACYLNLGSLYGKEKNEDKAITYYSKALELSKQIGQTEWIRDCYYGLANSYTAKKQFEKALDNYREYSALKDSILNETGTRQIAEMQTRYETAQKQQQIEALETSKRMQSEKDAMIRNSVIAGLVLVTIMALLLLNRYRIKKKANEQLSEQNALIEEKNSNLQSAYSIIEEKNKNITDSINYAKRIQDALLPPKELKYRLFPDAFVLFQPRDIVSGDFYWFAEKNGKKLIAAVDCTGHGVPGAFMSMIGNAFLNEIVIEKGITTPSRILDELRAMIITSLKQEEIQGQNRGSKVQDGMDIALCCFDEKNSTVEFAGANNPLWHIRKGVVTETKGDKQPIGTGLVNAAPFTNHRVELQPGDSVYIFTDGYADQFGGDRGKKFKYKNLQKLILQVMDRPMPEQEKELDLQLNKWKGDLEQVDDILVIGIRV